MTALAGDRGTLLREPVLRTLPVAAGVIVYAGAQVVLNVAGFVEPGSTATGKTALGRAEHYANNSSGANGAAVVQVRRGTFAWNNSPGNDAVTLVNIGAPCWIVDDNTVAATSANNTRSPAGVVFAVDADGVWVTIE